MVRVVALLLLIFQITSSRQLITNGDILFYYDNQRKMASDIKGNIFSDVDISQIDVGIIIDREHYYLRDYIQEVLTDKEQNQVEVSGAIKGVPYKVTYSFMNENEFLVKFILFGELRPKEDMKISYSIFPKKDNGYLELGKNGRYIYDGKISFEDGQSFGDIYFSTDPIQKGQKYFLSKVKGREVNFSDRYIYYIVPVKEQEAELIIKFGTLSNAKNKEKSPNLTLEHYREIEREQLNQLNLFISRAVIPSEISYNRPKVDYINELNLKYLGSYYKLSYISDILEKQRPKILEKIYYDYIIFKIIEENPNLKSRGKDFYGYTKKYIDTIFDEVYNEGSIQELFYFHKLLGILEKYASEEGEDWKKLMGYRGDIFRLVKENFYHERGLKSSRYSKTGEVKNLIYSDIIGEEERRDQLKKQLKENYSRDYGVFFQDKNRENPEEIDMEYNLNMVIFLYSMGERRKADLLLGKLEELIRKNSYYIPKYFPIKNRNENGIYGEMISKYFQILMKGERW